MKSQENVMLSIMLSPEAEEKLRALLEDEGTESLVRIREVKIGGG